MVLVKLILADDGVTVTSYAWANPTGHKAGDPDSLGGAYTYYDVASQDEIDACVDGYTKLTDGHLVVNADYVAPVEETPEATPSAQDTINAQLLKATATNAQANAAIMKQLATLTAGDTTAADTTKEAE